MHLHLWPVQKQKFKGNVLSLKRCVNNLLKFYALATPAEIQEGINWYKNANLYAAKLAKRFRVESMQAAGIISVFSPQTTWEQNKRFASLFLANPMRRVRSGIQSRKARRILKLNANEEIYNSLSLTDRAFKTKAFFSNITNFDKPTSVTIDRHAIAACIQNPAYTEAMTDEQAKLTKAQYEFFELCYKHAATQLNLYPHQFQSIIWVVYRRLRELNNQENYF